MNQNMQVVNGVTVVQTTWQQNITTHTLTRLDPGTYTGDVNSEGKREGFGRCKWSDGSNYTGQWWNGVRHGKGVFKSREGTLHDGMFHDDIRHGPGEMTYASGNKVIATWENNRINGPGKMINNGKKPIDVIFKDDIAITS